MLRAVLDANIWLRALLRRASYSGQVVDLWVAGRFTLIVSEPVLDEVLDVLTRPKLLSKFGQRLADGTALVFRMRILGERVPITGSPQGCRDPDDDALIETALAAGADALVSEDKDLLSMTVPGLAIVDAAGFLAMLDQEP